MLNAKGLLDQFLGQGAGGDLGRMLGQVTGAASGQSGSLPGQRRDGSAGGGPSVGGFNLKDMVSGHRGLATGALAGGLAGLLMGGKSGRKIAKNALTVGGLALVGGIAYSAYRDWQKNKGAPPSVPNTPPQANARSGTPVQLPPPNDAAFLPQTPAEEDALSLALIRAMIAATKADGHITADERARIAQQLEALGLDADGQRFIREELEKPLDIDAVARPAQSPEQAAEIYAASLLAIDPDGAAERGYLAMLAVRLKLDPALVQHLHARAADVQG